MIFLLLSLIIIIVILTLIKIYYINGPTIKNKHSMEGKFIIITGSSSGIGKYTAQELIYQNSTVIFAARNEKKVLKIISEFPDNLKKNAIYINLDLCSFNSIQIFCNKIISNFPKIDILINNAGNQINKFNITENCYDSNIQGNFLGVALLTFLLSEHLNDKSKIIFVSSKSHFFADLNKENKLNNLKYIKENYYNNFKNNRILYGNSKLLIMFFTSYLVDYFEELKLNVKIVSLHPGRVNTEFIDKLLGNFKLVYFLMKFVFFPFRLYFLKNIKQGAQTQLYLSYIDYNEIVNGGYYVDCKLANVSNKVKDNELKKEYINWTIENLKSNVKNNKIINSLKLI